MHRYHYSPLSQEPNTIRLLRLLPSEDKLENLRCELLEYFIQDSDITSDLYEALSYFWGGDDKPQSVIITGDRGGDHRKDSTQLAVTQNLYAALLQLRHHQFPRLIWVDAICIDQENEEEKEHQIQLMPAIYAKARSVIVWLGEAQDDGDQVLESIRIAGEKQVVQNKHALRKWGRKAESYQGAVQRLLERPWFRRIWVLQEVAAARHIQIMCGSVDINGHAFCLGLDVLNATLDVPSCPVTSLIRGAIFRSTQISINQGRISLDTCSLGELVDAYHAHGATKRHDKIYALLGMSFDDLSTAGLEPNYKMPWEKLMRSLIRYFLGCQVSINAWKDREIAMVKGKGDVIGRVSTVNVKQNKKPGIEITFQYILGNGQDRGNRNEHWFLPSTANTIQQGDVICLLQGAQKPTIIRPYQDYFAVIMITATPTEHMQTELSYFLRPEDSVTRDFLLIWNWEKFSENPQVSENYDGLILEPHQSELKDRLRKSTNIWNVALILGDLGAYEKARILLEEAIAGYKITLGEEHSHTLESQYGLTPLALAARNGYAEVIDLLLTEDGVDLDLKDWTGRTPLSHTAENGHEGVVRLLLETGKIDIDAKDKDGRTPLSWAAENGHEVVAKLLFQVGRVDVDAKSLGGRTPLSWAAENGHEAVAKLLLETGCVDINTKNKYNETPLTFAAQNGHEAVTKLLLETGRIDVDVQSVGRRTPLLWAAENGHVAVTKLLLETRRVDINAKSSSSQTPLSLAAKNGHEAVTKLLLETGRVDVDVKDISSETPLHGAAKNGHEAVVKLLLETGQVDVDSKNLNVQSPLQWAAKNGHDAVVKLLLETGRVDVNAKYQNRQTPLSCAAENGHEAVVKRLLETGCVDINTRNYYHETPLSLAAKNRHQAVVTLLNSAKSEKGVFR